MESAFKVLVGHGVNDGVDQRVEVSQPGEDVEKPRVETGIAGGNYQGVDEERQPAHDVRAQNDPQSLGGFPLSGGGDSLLFQQRVGHRDLHLIHRSVAGRGVVCPVV